MIKIPKYLIISGPTASGKSDLAEEIYKKTGGLIVNADSMQIYKNLPILSAQPTICAHHKLYSILNYDQPYSCAKWVDDVKALDDNLPIIIVGGTGLYIKSLIYGLSQIPDIPEFIKKEVTEIYEQLGKDKFYESLIKLDPKASKIFSSDKQRMQRAYSVKLFTNKSIFDYHAEVALPKLQNFIHISLVPERAYLYDRINKRLDSMISCGAIEEVKSFMSLYDNRGKYQILATHGLIEIESVIRGEITLEQAKNIICQKIRNYAKRQLTWFRHQSEANFMNYNDIIELNWENLLNKVFR